MARYYFHVRHGSGPVAEDPDGDDLVDLDQVRTHALDVARDLIARTRLESVRNWFDCTFEVADAMGRPVLRVPFGDAIVEDETEADDAA